MQSVGVVTEGVEEAEPGSPLDYICQLLDVTVEVRKREMGVWVGGVGGVNRNGRIVEIRLVVVVRERGGGERKKYEPVISNSLE